MGRNTPLELLPGTLDLLILKTLVRGAAHGYGIAQMLKQTSDDVLEVGESSLYPALQRLLLNGWVQAEWGASENNRRARFYTLTAGGANGWRRSARSSSAWWGRSKRSSALRSRERSAESRYTIPIH